ncbi:hypothetical protein SADUNF_Sadunf07G0053700 [Salix dunnii]|uniref:Uncharacterized protein n=1 Tax=Salix dunnii TaxID=1413687 RepID=A0A835N298_9ROSI|nr:hypothetical protein SADUNF_Sadunf07G0053700 [Salix dunnii]
MAFAESFSQGLECVSGLVDDGEPELEEGGDAAEWSDDVPRASMGDLFARVGVERLFIKKEKMAGTNGKGESE